METERDCFNCIWRELRLNEFKPSLKHATEVCLKGHRLHIEEPCIDETPFDDTQYEGKPIRPTNR